MYNSTIHDAAFCVSKEGTMYSELHVRKIGRMRWILLEDWVTPYGTVPKGFESNGASVPRFMWWFVTPTGILFEAAILHDYYYKEALEDKPFADEMFKDVALTYGATEVEATLSYFGVVLLGRGTY